MSVPHEATYDAILSPPAANVLSAAPIIEVTKFHLKSSVSRDAWLAQQAAVQKLLDEAKGCKGYASGFVEGKDEYLVLVGWESVEAHNGWAQAEKEKPDSACNRYVAMVTGAEMCHVAIREVMPGASRH